MSSKTITEYVQMDSSVVFADADDFVLRLMYGGENIFFRIAESDVEKWLEETPRADVIRQIARLALWDKGSFQLVDNPLLEFSEDYGTGPEIMDILFEETGYEQV